MEAISYSPNDGYYTDNMTTTESSQNGYATLKYECSVNMEHVVKLFLGIDITIAIIGIIGNILVQIVTIKNHHMRNSMNLLIFNLSLADLLFIFAALPPHLWLTFPIIDSVSAIMIYNCMLGDLVYYLFQHCSALTLMVIALERYVVVCHPLRAKFVCTKKRTIIIIIVIWIISGISAWPNFMVYKSIMKNGVLTCVATRAINYNAYIAAVSILFCGIPLAIIVAVYSIIAYNLFKYQDNLNIRCNESQLKERREILNMLILIVIIFVVCLVPLRLHPAVTQTTSICTFRLELIIVGSLYYLNASINPIVYAFCSRIYWSEFKKIFRSQSQQSRDSSDFVVTSST